MKVFVYGTLKSNGRLHDMFLYSSKFIGKTIIDGFDMYHNGFYPTIIPGTNKVHGEVYEVDEETLYSLDLLEGIPYHYSREIVQTEFGECFIYVGKHKSLYFIPSGNY